MKYFGVEFAGYNLNYSIADLCEKNLNLHFYRMQFAQLKEEERAEIGFFVK